MPGMSFDKLTPDTILKAAEMAGFKPTGVIYPLNSYENRVYDVRLEDGSRVIAKFYRPGRWNLAAIQEEHDFVWRLAQSGLAVVAPLEITQAIKQIRTLLKMDEFYVAFTPHIKGVQHADYSERELALLGDFLARLHNVGADFRIKERPVLDPESYGYAQLEKILTLPFIPHDILDSLQSTLMQAVDATVPYFENEWEYVTVHGDFHAGNVLWCAGEPNVVDFDDMLEAPPVQDVWMLINGRAEEKIHQKKAFFTAYEKIRAFDHDSLALMEPLRTLRLVRHAAWIGGRYSENAFKLAFPYFTQRRFWEEYLLTMKEQVGVLQEI